MTYTTQEQQSYRRFSDMVGDFIIPREMQQTNREEYQRKTMAGGVKAGQLWVANDGGYATYIAVLAVSRDRRTIMGVPMEADVDLQTQDSLVLTGHTPLGMPMVAWPKLRVEIPVRLLSKPVGEFEESLMRSLASNTADGSIFRRGESPRFDMDEDAYDELVAHLKQWHRKCGQLPPLHQPRNKVGISQERIRAMRQLMRKLHMTEREALGVVNRETPLTDEARNVLEEADIDLSGIPVRSNTLPAELLIEVEQPRWRAEADWYETHVKGDPRFNLAQAAVDLAARVSGDDEQSWRKRLHTVAASRTSNDGDSRRVGQEGD